MDTSRSVHGLALADLVLHESQIGVHEFVLAGLVQKEAQPQVAAQAPDSDAALPQAVAPAHGCAVGCVHAILRRGWELVVEVAMAARVRLIDVADMEAVEAVEVDAVLLDHYGHRVQSA